MPKVEQIKNRKLGRPRKLTPKREAKMIEDYLSGRGTTRAIGKRYGVCYTLPRRAAVRAAEEAAQKQEAS